MKDKRLILIRHAHRDTQNHAEDNGLSDQGLKQVKKVLKFSKLRDLERAVFISSPKKRCLETISPVADEFKANLKIESALGEGVLNADLESFLDAWRYEGSAVTVACSHGDVIPTIVEKLTGGNISIKKAGWCEIELVGGNCYLTWLVQKYD